MSSAASISIAAYRAAHPALQFGAPLPGILEVIIANEARLNAAGAALHRDLAQVWRTIDADAAVRAVLVRGAGAHFCRGATSHSSKR